VWPIDMFDVAPGSLAMDQFGLAARAHGGDGVVDAQLGWGTEDGGLDVVNTGYGVEVLGANGAGSGEGEAHDGRLPDSDEDKVSDDGIRHGHVIAAVQLMDVIVVFREQTFHTRAENCSSATAERRSNLQ